MKKKVLSIPALIGGILSLAAGIAEIIYGAVYEQYADAAVVAALLAGGLLLLVYTLTDKKWTDWLGFIGTLVSAWGMGLFLVNSYNVWADTWGNIQQYGQITGAFNFFNSQGGPIPAAVILFLALFGAIFGAVSCFRKRGTQK